MVGVLVIFIVLGGAAAAAVSIYNRLVSLKAGFKNAFAQIEVQLTRRHDLIPNIVETAKAYLKHENETLVSVINARNGAAASLKEAAAKPGDPASIALLNSAEQKLAASFSGMRIQLEAYPELKSNTVMMQLSEQLSATEDAVANARQAYNNSATTYNIARNSFPAALLASLFGHEQDAALLSFANTEEIQAAPKVSF